MPRLARPQTDTLTLADALAAWDRSLRVSGKSPRTITAYAYATAKLAAAVGETIPLDRISSEHIEALLLSLKDTMTPAGLSTVYRPLRTFFGWCVKREHLSRSPMAGIDPPRVIVQPVEFVTDDEFAAIVRTTVERSRHAFRARRDRAILLLLATTGARLNEIASLKVTDVDLITDVVTVLGKGGKVRLLPILPDTKTALLAYMRTERPRSPYAAAEALWLAPRGPMTGSGIAQMVAERGKMAGIARRVHPHELRHRFIAKALRGGLSGPLVMAVSGHTTASMLNRYGAFTRSQDAMDALRALAATGTV